MSRLPLFPLGTVLVPGAVLPLHIFEPRYRALLTDLTREARARPAWEAEFGVVLIERGSEVGGGDRRMSVGTAARLLEATELPDGRWVVAVVGTHRFRVQQWLPDDPYPLAEVVELVEAGAVEATVLGEAERLVRRALGLAAELGESSAPMTFELERDPLVASWQLVALAPLGPADTQVLLETADPTARLAFLAGLVGEVAATLALRLSGGP